MKRKLVNVILPSIKLFLLFAMRGIIFSVYRFGLDKSVFVIFFIPFQNYGRLICFENVTLCHKCVTNILLLKFVSSKTKWLKYSWKSHVTNLWSKFQVTNILFAEKSRTCFETKSSLPFRDFFCKLFSHYCQFLSFYCLLTLATDFLCKKSFRRCTMIQQKACIWMCGCNVILHIVLTCEKR